MRTYGRNLSVSLHIRQSTSDMNGDNDSARNKNKLDGLKLHIISTHILIVDKIICVRVSDLLFKKRKK